MNQKNKPGKVYIIGAGPGDAGLITIKAVDCLRLADVVVYDNLVNEELLKYAPEKARFIYAGKKAAIIHCRRMPSMIYWSRRRWSEILLRGLKAVIHLFSVSYTHLRAHETRHDLV